MKPHQSIKKHHELMWKRSVSFFQVIKKPIFLYLFTLVNTLIFFFALIFYYLEVGLNPNIKSFFDAFYYAVTIMTGVGLGDITANTLVGRILSIVMMFLGTAIFVTFTAVLATSILEEDNKFKEETNTKKYKN